MPCITACATLGYAAFDARTALARIAARGFNKVEITELGAYCRHYPYRQTNAAYMRKLLGEYSLMPIAINVSSSRLVDGRIFRPRLTDPRCAEEVIEYASWFIREASDLGICMLSFPIGPRLLEGNWKKEIKAATAVYRRIADRAAERGISFNLEVPHLYQLTDSVEHVKSIFTELSHPAIGAVVDSSHWGIIQYDLDDFLNYLGPRLHHIHLRDSTGNDTLDFNQDLERTPGKGTVDFVAFGRALDRVGYTGEVSIEFEYRHADIEIIEKEFDEGIAHLKDCGWEFPAGI